MNNARLPEKFALAVTCVCLFLAVTVPFAVRAQSKSDEKPQFEVASVKPLAPEESTLRRSTGAGYVTQDPGMISMKSISLDSLLVRAYGLKPFQISGPDWLATQFYEVTAKLPAGVTPDQIPTMLQKLLTERFRMTVRWDTKQETGYTLAVDKGGPKLKASVDQSTHEGDEPDKPRSVSMSDKTRMQGATTAALTSFLSNTLGEPVTDSTGLKGRFDITLNVSFQQLAAAIRGPSPSSDDNAYTPGVLVDAVRDLGLRLDPQKVQVKHLTVVKADRIPTEN